jgi:hypothetical protein
MNVRLLFLFIGILSFAGCQNKDTKVNYDSATEKDLTLDETYTPATDCRNDPKAPKEETKKNSITQTSI